LPLRRREFVLADITTDEFRDEITRLTSGYDTRVFAFLGSTFGNTNQTHMVDSLWNVLKPSDTLWLHVLVRPSLKTVDDMRLFNRYAAYLANARMMERFFFPLHAVGIPFGNGKMQLASDKEESVGAMLFKFSFVFSTKTVISCRDEKLHFLPGEKIDLISIRVYHERTLVNFFMEHEFHFKSVQCEPLSAEVVRGQFLFKKNA